jgi:hypothetical protein
MNTPKKNWKFASSLAAALWAVGLAASAAALERPLIWPLPQKMEVLATPFVLDESVPILVPADRPAADLALARMLVAELSDRYGLALKVEAVASVPAGKRHILLGAAANPLVKAQCASRQLPPPTAAESYRLHVTAEAILVAGADDTGAFYGLQSLRQLVTREGGKTFARGAAVEDHPHMPFRAIRLYLPGHENIAYFKRFLRDFMALYKFNKVLMEVNASMRLDRHPELNAGWIDFAKDLYYTQRYNPRGPNQTSQNSAHHDTADGEILEKDEVADLVEYARRLHIEIIPEIPTFTHSYYLLTRHKHLAAIPDAEWPDTYMPTNPDVYKLVFDVMDEYIEVMKPKMIHIGHDEMFFPIEAVRGNQGKTMQELFAYDVQKLHGYLTAKGIKTAMYGDHLIESVRGEGTKPMKSSTGWAYNMPGALSPQQVRDLIPKDILVFNWFWIDARAAEGRGEPNDIKLQDFGFKWSYMNFTSFIENWPRRSVRPSVVGGSPAHWSATADFPMGKDMMVALLGTVNLMWSTHWPDTKELHRNVQSMLPEIRRNLRGRNFPSEDGDPTVPLDLTAQVSKADFGVDLSALKPGALTSRGKQFVVPAGGAVLAATASNDKNPRPREAGPIPVGADVSSIVFLHATAGPAANDMSYRYIHNFPDTADLLGWYDVVYQDGFVQTVPIRYGVNILPLGWGQQPDILAKGNAKEWSYAYEAELVENGPHTLFAYEWVNPRFGKPVKEIRLHGTVGFIDTKGKPTPDNVIVLAGVSIVKKRPVPPAVATSGKN